MAKMTVELVDGKCRGCNICIRSCPLRIINVVNGLAVLTGECIGCGKCIDYCPFHARVMVPREEVEA